MLCSPEAPLGLQIRVCGQECWVITRASSHMLREWENLPMRIRLKFIGGEDISRWQRLARKHDARHPHIKPELIDALEAHVCRSYRQLSQCVDGWCSTRTIERWLNSHPTFEVYKKNIKPGLTEVNKVKQVNFSDRVVDHRWYLSATTKILWAMGDEKWFHALVPRYGFTLKVYTTEPM